jgi:hypothetical protein
MAPVHHIGYWVEDLPAAVDRAVETLGIGPFLVHPHVAFDAFRLADGTEITDEAYFDHSAAFAAWGPIVLELGEIHSIDPHLSRAYGIRPGQVGHVSWIVEDLATESRRLVEAGAPLIHTAGSSGVTVAWHSGGRLFGHPIELHQAGAPILGMHARLAEAASTWDGREAMQPLLPGTDLDRTGGR